MSSLTTGQRYLPDQNLYLEGAHYAYRDDGHELALFLRGITDRQVADLQRGAMELALVIDRSEIVFCARFGATIPWSRAEPFRSRDVPRKRRGMPPAPEVTPGLHALLRVVLIEADGGLVRAQRGIFLSPAFTTALHAAIRVQSARPEKAADGRRDFGTAPEPPAAHLHRLYRESEESIPRGLIRRSFEVGSR